MKKMMRESTGRSGQLGGGPFPLFAGALALALLLLGSGRAAFAFELTEADCRCCHTSGVPDRHHLLVQTKNAACLDCHRMVPKEGTGLLEAEVVRDCLLCHSSSLADRHHLAAQGSGSECLSCHAVLFDPAAGSYYVDLQLGCRSSVPAETCTDGADNDADALVDCADPDCASTAPCLPPETGEVCTDGADNDGDTLADCADADCAGTDACRPGQTGHYALHGTPGSGCTACHLPNLIDGHGQGCAVCHQSASPAVREAVSAGRTECVACHSPAPHETGCRTCHTTVRKKLRRDQIHRRHLSAVPCGVCHGVPETVRLEPSGLSCRSCHGASRPWSRGSVPELHRTHARRGGRSAFSCAFCHGRKVPPVSPGDCALCHPGTTFAPADLPRVHRTHSRLFDCANCHLDVRDLALETPGAACGRCHESRPYASVPALHQKHRGFPCRSCHGGDGVAARPAGGCASCHGKTPPPARADFLHRRHSGAAIPCRTCHSEVVPPFMNLRKPSPRKAP